MKEGIHPDYAALKATCSCGNVIETRSTLEGDLSLDICSACHPFYTGKQKIVDTGGRVDRFKKRFAKTAGAATPTEKQEAPAEEVVAEEAPAEEVVAEEAPAEEVVAEEVAEEAPAEEVVAEEAPAEEASTEENSEDSPKEK